MNKLALAALAAVTVVPAFAQSSESNNISVRVGAFLPTDSQAKKTSKTWLAVGGTYTLKYGAVTKESGYSADYAISLDYYGRGDYRALPVLFNYVGHLSAKLYYVGGVGVSFNRYEKGLGTKSETGFSFAIGAGYTVIEGPQPIFVEARYWGNDESKLSGFGVYAGIRF